ncbi:hypothetical protein AVDCRST_MAG82-557 [uncultured Rubrobacteraceae bacterium]|uniref:Uncharacterized protein n=1 Tax=uncultured Rubrobacteraceae bacterium TaxID=349277 RepID=A0A6J4P8A2_9ACTN|nr:hypothetical protein AVDCRST_MAG82-557 [uncultured Rubrobacteraceae bacterium]
MIDEGKQRDVQDAARRFAETLAESYRLVYGQAAESNERQQRRAREFSELVQSNLREQAESGRDAARQFSEQASRQQEAGQAFARESVEAYTDFLNSTFSRYRTGTERATGAARQGLRNLSETTTGLVGTATGAAGSAMGATADATQSAADTATFPIPGYDEMNVEEISERVSSLSPEQVQRLKDYEQENQNRKTLIERYDSRLRASS